MAVATYNDVEVALGRSLTSSSEQAQVEWWLNGVERFIVRRLGPVAELDPDDVQFVEAEAVAAKVRRSGTLESSITVAVDDGTVTRRYENPVSAGDITTEWWHLLAPDTSSGAFSVRPGFEPDTTPESWE